MTVKTTRIEHQGGFFVLWPVAIWNELSADEQQLARALLPNDREPIIEGSVYRLHLRNGFRMEKLPDEVAAVFTGKSRELATKRKQHRVDKSIGEVMAEIQNQLDSAQKGKSI